MNILDSMREQIILDFTPAWGLNDPAHQVKHFSNVEKCGNEINQRLGLGYDARLILLVAFFHDMFAWSRINHHDLSGVWVKGTDYPLITQLTFEERQMVEFGCREHRASFKGIFASEFSELMNSADRELPGDVEAMVTRAVQYRVARGMSEHEAYAPAVEHIKEKFGSDGYARYPDFYLDAFGAELTKQREDIKNL